MFTSIVRRAKSRAVFPCVRMDSAALANQRTGSAKPQSHRSAPSSCNLAFPAGFRSDVTRQAMTGTKSAYSRAGFWLALNKDSTSLSVCHVKGVPGPGIKRFSSITQGLSTILLNSTICRTKLPLWRKVQSRVHSFCNSTAFNPAQPKQASWETIQLEALCKLLVLQASNASSAKSRTREEFCPNHFGWAATHMRQRQAFQVAGRRRSERDAAKLLKLLISIEISTQCPRNACSLTESRQMARSISILFTSKNGRRIGWSSCAVRRNRIDVV